MATYSLSRGYMIFIKYFKKNNNNIYCLDIVDQFSKLSQSYLLKNKTSELALSIIKSFINVNGPCKIFKAYKVLEFNNIKFKNLFGNLKSNIFTALRVMATVKFYIKKLKIFF